MSLLEQGINVFSYLNPLTPEEVYAQPPPNFLSIFQHSVEINDLKKSIQWAVEKDKFSAVVVTFYFTMDST